MDDIKGLIITTVFDIYGVRHQTANYWRSKRVTCLCLEHFLLMPYTRGTLDTAPRQTELDALNGTDSEKLCDGMVERGRSDVARDGIAIRLNFVHYSPPLALYTCPPPWR